MTPRQYKEYAAAERKQRQEEAAKLAEEWHVPLDALQLGLESPAYLTNTLRSAKKTMERFALAQNDVPFIIKLIENPKYDIGLFAGNVSLETHDYIHILLGRGLLVKDEAFVIGYTMGSTKKMPRWRRNLFMFVSKYLYPEGYKFKEDERFIFNMGVIAGNQCKSDLSGVDFSEFLNEPIEYTRHKLGIDVVLLKNCYGVEKASFKDRESQRLL